MLGPAVPLQDPLRSGPGGASASAGVDLEALEAENDRSIAALGERVGALRGITTGIHGEAESQHRLLDGMVSEWRGGWITGVGGWGGLELGMTCYGGMREEVGQRMMLPASPTSPQPLSSPLRCTAVSQSMSMGGVHLTLRATADKMSRVMSEPRQRRLVAAAGGAAVVLFLLYVWLWR